ncbi:unnamed protein product, partial [Pocillopora meandrina]
LEILHDFNFSLPNSAESSSIVLVGGVNLPPINWSTDLPVSLSAGSHAMDNIFCELIDDNFLQQFITGSTHISGSTLDLIVGTLHGSQDCASEVFVETRIHQFNCHYQRATLHAANLGCLFKQTIQRLSIAELDNINDRRNTQTNTEWSKKTAQRPGILLERQSMKTFQEKCCQSSYKNVAV